MIKENIITREFEKTEIQFKIDEQGQSFVRINEVARFCGWTQIKNGKEYIKWERVNEKLALLGFPNVGESDFIPENIMYPLIGMADFKKNEKAREFMLWVGQVLVQLRTKGVVITEKATEEAIDFEKKYGTYRIRKTFTNSNNLRADWEEFKDLSKAEWKAKRLSGQDRIKLHNIIFDAISKRLQNNITELKGSEMLAMQELLTDIKSDTLKLCNNVNGGIKRGQTQEIGKLKAELESLKPVQFEDMVKVDNYAISKNDLHEPSIHSITGEVMIRNTNEYNGWKWYFQKAMDKANIKELFSHIDWNEPVEISYGVTCHEQNDISNFIDALQDVLKEYFNCDDKKFLIGTQLIVGIEPAKMKRKTWLYFRNVNENDYIVKNGVVA